MIIVAEQKVLSNAINVVAKAASSKTTMPILTCILVNADNSSGIKFTAYDNEMGIQLNIIGKGDVVEEGSIAVDARLFGEIIRKTDGENELRVETIDSIVKITSANGEFKLQGLDPDQFPKLPLVNGKYTVSISQFNLKEAIKDTIFSISANSSNKILSGVLFEIDGDEFKLTSSDGHRISLKKVFLEKEYSSHHAIVPGKVLDEISRLLSDNVEDMVEICFEENDIMFSFNDTIVTSRLIDGKYFNVKSMLLSDYDTLVKVKKRDFMEDVERAAIFQRETDRRPLVISIKDDSMNLRINTDLGSFNSNIPIEKNGEDLMIGFNPTFILDVLKVIDVEEVPLYLTSPKAPLFIRDDGNTYIYLIMPINFNPAAYED